MAGLKKKRAFDSFLDHINFKMKFCLNIASTKRNNPIHTVKEMLSLMSQLEKKDVKPNATSYELLASAYSRLDNVDNVVSLVPAMLAQDIQPTRAFFHTALQYTGRLGTATEQAIILNDMQKAGVPRTSQTYMQMLACMENNREFERALDTLTLMRQEGVEPNQNSLMSVIKLAVLFGHADIANDLLSEMEKGSDSGLNQLFACMQVLRCAAVHNNYNVVKTRWRVVTDKRLEPDDGLCRLALYVAARAGDAELASDIMKVVGDLGYAYHETHFVSLVEAYASTMDIISTFQVLTLMRRAGFVPGRRVAAPIVRMFGLDVKAVEQAEDAMKQLAAQSLPVDVAALNAVIHGLAHNGENEKAIALYERASEFRVVPDMETIEAVLGACIHSKRADYGRALYVQYIEKGTFKPTENTFSKLIVLECTQEDYNDAFEYLQHMKQQKLVPHLGCYGRLVRTLAAAQDPRIWSVISDMESHGFKVSDDLKNYISTYMPDVVIDTPEPCP